MLSKLNFFSFNLFFIIISETWKLFFILIYQMKYIYNKYNPHVIYFIYIYAN